MEEVLYYSALYDCYQALLTEKQKHYFENYYFYNLSFGEIAENEGISRNAVCKQVKEVCKKLENYEKKLHLYFLKQEITKLLETADNQTVKQQLNRLLEEIEK